MAVKWSTAESQPPRKQIRQRDPTQQELDENDMDEWNPDKKFDFSNGPFVLVNKKFTGEFKEGMTKKFEEGYKNWFNQCLQEQKIP